MFVKRSCGCQGIRFTVDVPVPGSDVLEVRERFVVLDACDAESDDPDLCVIDRSHLLQHFTFEPMTAAEVDDLLEKLSHYIHDGHAMRTVRRLLGAR